LEWVFSVVVGMLSERDRKIRAKSLKLRWSG
jgi:hypothetical protein